MPISQYNRTKNISARIGWFSCRFVLQALDPDHGSPVFEAAFFVSEIEDLRTLLVDAGDDPTLERGYFLDAAEIAAINQRFATAFDPDGREVLPEPWRSIRDVPYLIHTCYELPLLLEGRKQLARFNEAYPPDHHWNEEKFDRYVAEGALHREVVVEPSELVTLWLVSDELCALFELSLPFRPDIALARASIPPP